MSAALAFVALQLRAAVFGIALLALVLASKALWPADAPLARYDFLFLCALGIQFALIGFGWETWREARVILVFHLVGTLMELFKTSVGSWSYPEANLIRIAGVPLFSGFMYASVGSYMARVQRLSGMRFERYPPLWATAVLAGLIYMNFYTHHYGPDLRLGLFAGAVVLFGPVRARLDAGAGPWRVPLLALFVMIAVAIWAAENLATLGGIWLYPNQHDGWAMVPLSKFGSWFLLMLVSFVLVSLVRDEAAPQLLHSRKAASKP